MASATPDESAPTGNDGTQAVETEVAKVEEKAEAGKLEEVKEKKKRGIKKGAGKNEEEGVKTPAKAKKRKSCAEQATPVDRPSRERKTVERYMAMSPRKPMTPKVIPIKQGLGTKLRDIPNVFFKLSKRRVDENLQHLHRILFGKKATVKLLKRNLFEFSGFVWSNNEEKEKAKLREKLDKCVRDRLLDFCDVLDIPVSRGGSKKEDLLALMLNFLLRPCVTRDILLKDKEQSGKKRKRRVTRGNKTILGEKKRRKKRNSGKTRDEVNEKEEENRDEDASAGDIGTASDEEVSDHSNQDKNETAEEDIEIDSETVEKVPTEQPIKKENRSSTNEERKSPPKRKSENNEETSKKKGGSRTTALEKSSHVKRVSAEGNNVELASPSGFKSKNAKSRNKKNQGSSTRKANKNQDPETKAKSRTSGKYKAAKKDVGSPTKEEMHAVVCDILREVDFNTATLADILKQLGAHFGTDLIHRKAEVKSIIEEVISSMSDDESDNEDGVKEDSEKEDNAEKIPGKNDDSKGKSEKATDFMESQEKDE